MNDLESIIMRRRAIRKFAGGKIDDEKLERLVELALWAPTSCNRQTVRFRFVRDRGLISAVAKAAFDQAILHQPITLAIVCIDTSRYRNTTLEDNLAPYLDAGLALQNFLLAATEMGIGTCVVAGRLDQELVRKTLNLPDEWLVTAFVAVGEAGEEQPPPERCPVEHHVSFDDEKVPGDGNSYEDYSRNRMRWARAGWDVGVYYKYPKEGLRVYDHVYYEMERRLGGNERWLVTSTMMGMFCFDEGMVDHLSASDDESWFLKEFLGKEISVVRGSPVSGSTQIESRTYDRIVSPFDMHYFNDEDITAFIDNCVRWLDPGGRLTVIFFNSHSCWGFNYLLSRLLGRDPGRFRLFGYEVPLPVGNVVKSLQPAFSAADRRTISFLPPLNIGYISGRMRQVPFGFMRSLDLFGNVPLIRNLGNIAIVDFVLNR